MYSKNYGKQKIGRDGKSFIGRMLSKMSGFISSIVNKSHVGQAIVDYDKTYENSSVHKILEDGKVGRSSKAYSAVNIFLSKSMTARFFKRITTSLLAMSMNVYAMFFTVYGIASAFVCYALMFLNRSDGHGMSGLITSVVILLLSLPFLMTSQSLTEIAAGSLIFGRIVRDFLMIPEENLHPKKRVGSTGHMFLFAALGLLAGALTYFLDPLYAPLAFLAIIIFLVVMRFPEGGIMLIAVTVPFLQYAQNLRIILPVLVCTTCLSYLFKVGSGKRVGVNCTEGVLLGFFCVFMLLASCFTRGGWQTALDAAYAVIIIIGGFFVTFNLLRNEKKLNACLSAMLVSFGILVFMGMWDMTYASAVEFLHNSWTGITHMISNRIFYIAGSASSFGVMAALVSPVLLCKAVSRKSITGIMLSVFGLALAIFTTLVYGTYEAAIAILIGFVIYLVFHGKKSFVAVVTVTAVLFVAISLTWSFAPESVTNKIEASILTVKPTNDPDAAMREQLNGDVEAMLKDGHLSGIGVGEHIFIKEFYDYASETTQDVMGPANLYAQIVCWSGVGGLISFILLFLWIFKSAVGYMIASTNKKLRRIVLALSCGLLSALMLGSVTNLWSDMRTFYLFWMMTALLCGYVRLGRVRDERRSIGSVIEPDRADVNVRYHD